jgi:hypothetical protein
MKKLSLLAACVAVPLALAASASARADDYYGGRYSGGYEGRYDGGNGYDGYGGYRSDHYGDFYRRYLSFLRECRKHRRLHGELKGLHGEAHDEGFEYRGQHRDTHDALGATHQQYHQNHPLSNYCPSYSEYRQRYSYYRNYRWDRRSGGYGYSGDE